MFNHSNKGIAAPVVILIVVFILIVGFLAYKYWWPSETSAPEQTATPEDTTNWKTYTNEKYAYQLKYPQEWDEQKPGEPPYPGPPEGVEFYTQDTDNFCRAAVEASTFSFDGEIDSLRTKEYTENIIKVSGIDATQFESAESNATPIFIYLEYQGNFYRITRGWGATSEIDQKCKSVFDGIVSSFQFIEIERSALEQACLDSGGEVGQMLCCKSNGDFPNMCLIGSCSCHPDDSHYVKVCACGYEKCFNGETCVSQ